MGNKARRLVSLVLVIGLFFQQVNLAQAAGALSLSGYLNNASAAGNALSQDKFRPVQMRYFSYEPSADNFKILLDKGDISKLEDKKAREEAQILLNYFLVGVALPDDAFWVNLRPDSQNQIIDPLLEKTEAGRIMLAADLQLKKDTSSLTSPQTPEGRKYWDKLYQKAEELYGHSPAQIPTITRPWIVPGEIIVRESENSAYVYKAGLKVMLEEDYLSSQPSAISFQQHSFSDPRLKELNQYSTRLIKELIIPKLTKEINSSKRYASLRQVYYSLILSRWFKLRFSGKSGTYASLINTGNLTNLTSNKPWDKGEYFNQYQMSFSKGEYNLKEQVATLTGHSVRSYVSGGMNWVGINPANGAIFPGDNLYKPGMLQITGSANSPLETDMQTNVAGSFDSASTSSPVSSPEILFFGGSAVGFYEKALKNFKLVHAITPFDGGLVLNRNDKRKQLLSNVEDNPSSSGWLRASVEEDLPASGDITSIIIKRAAEDPNVPYYKKEILEARFTKNSVSYAGLAKSPKGAGFKDFSAVITFIAQEYRNGKKPNDPAKTSGFTDFMLQLSKYADEIDKIKMPDGALFWNGGKKELRHSIKNLIFYAILKKNSNQYNKYEKSLLEFAELAGGGKATLEDIMFSSYDLNGVELVAKVEKAGKEEYLCGQEEITQNLTEKSIKELFFAAREEVKEYVIQREKAKAGNEKFEKKIAVANIFRLPKVNPQLQKKIKDINERNKEESRNKNFIVFGPGSQFSSVLLHLKIPGVISALAEAAHTPRVMVLNPIKDYEISGIDDKDYFKEIVDTIERWIRSELKDDKKDISAIFDFIVVNDKVQNDVVIEKNAETSPNATNIARGKQRLGLIKYDINNIKNQLKNKSVILVTGNLLEVADGKVSYSAGAMEELFKAMQKFYVQRHQGNSDPGHRGGVLLAADLHATLNAALRFKLAFPDAPLLVIGDPSDRGHNLHRLLRLTDSFVSGDHELWAVGMASGVSDYLTAMYLRMAFSYENDDLLDDLGLGKILELALAQPILKYWETIGYLKKELSSPQKAGKLFNYIFSKIYFEEMCNKFYKENPTERQKALEKLFLVLAYACHPSKKIFQLEDGFGKKLEKILEDNKESFDPVRKLNKLREELKKIKGLTDEDKNKKTRIEEEILETEEKIVGQIKTNLKDGLPKDTSGNINLLTDDESSFLKYVKDIISEKLKGPDASDSLKGLIGHFLKGPIYREVQIGPQVPRTEELSQVRFIDPGSEQKVLLMHVLPPMVQNGSGFADMLGNNIPLDKLKDYYNKLNEALQTLRELFLKGELTSETKLFAGYERDAQGNIIADKEIPIDEWFVRISDTIYAPLFAREHSRIESEYIAKKEEPDNIIYDLLYKPDKGKVKDRDVMNNLKKYFGLQDGDFTIDGTLITLKEDGQEKIVQAILQRFGQADMLVVGHKKIHANQIVSLANGKLKVLDAEFAEKGGVTGALEHTQQGAALLRSDKGETRVVKLINMQQVFLNKAAFVNSFSEDSNFEELKNAENFDYYLLEEVRKEVIKSCGLRDIHYYNISVSPEDIRQAFNMEIGKSLDGFRKNNHGSLTVVGKLMDILKKDNRNINLSTFDDFEKALKEKGIQTKTNKGSFGFEESDINKNKLLKIFKITRRPVDVFISGLLNGNTATQDVVAVLNTILTRRDFYKEIKDEKSYKPYLSDELVEFLERVIKDPANISSNNFDLMRLNRAILEALYPLGILQPLNRKTIEGLLPGSSVWRLILDDKPQEFLLPVIVAEKIGNSMRYRIIRVDNKDKKTEGIAYYTSEDGDRLLDELLVPGQDERMDNGQPTLDNADFRNGSMLDDIPMEDIQSYIERVNGNLYSLENNHGKPLTADDLKPAREKFGPDGKVLPFKGLTTITWIGKDTLLYEQLRLAQENISRELLNIHLGAEQQLLFAPVDKASLHITIYDLIIGDFNGRRDISSEKYQEIHQEIKEAFKEIGNIGDIDIEVRGIGTFPQKPNLLMAKCYPKTQEDLKKIIQIRQKIENKTGIKSPYPFVAHVTLGYLVNPLSVEEYGRFLGGMNQYNNYPFGEFTFSSIDFTYFPDMNHFIPALTKDLVNGEFLAREFDVSRLESRNTAMNFEEIKNSCKTKMDQGGVFQYTLKAVKRSKPGKRLIKMYNPGRGGKRPKDNIENSMKPEFVPEAFNYRKINKWEIIQQDADMDGITTDIIVNISPFFPEHVLLVPENTQKDHNQVFTKEAARVALSHLRKMNRASYKVAFNSWRAFGSRNQLHKQAFDYTAPGENGDPYGVPANMPVENEAVKFLFRTQSGTEVSRLPNWLVNTFMLSGNNAEALQNDLVVLTDVLYDLKQPFNILFTYNPSAGVYKVYIYPRKPETSSKFGTGVAYLELSGEVLFINQNFGGLVLSDKDKDVLSKKGERLKGLLKKIDPSQKYQWCETSDGGDYKYHIFPSKSDEEGQVTDDQKIKEIIGDFYMAYAPLGDQELMEIERISQGKEPAKAYAKYFEKNETYASKSLKIYEDAKESDLEDEIKAVGIDEEKFNNIREKFEEATASSPTQSLPDKNTGGIDWRKLPMTVQPMGSFRGLDFGLPSLSLQEIERIDVQSQIGQIKSMVSSGISPSGRRVKELVAACVQKGQISAYADDLLACIGDILKLEEETAKESSPELKEALVIAELA